MFYAFCVGMNGRSTDSELVQSDRNLAVGVCKCCYSEKQQMRVFVQFYGYHGLLLKLHVSCWAKRGRVGIWYHASTYVSS